MGLLSRFPNGSACADSSLHDHFRLQLSHVLRSFPVLSLTAEVTHPSIRLKPVPPHG